MEDIKVEKIWFSGSYVSFCPEYFFFSGIHRLIKRLVGLSLSLFSSAVPEYFPINQSISRSIKYPAARLTFFREKFNFFHFPMILLVFQVFIYFAFCPFHPFFYGLIYSKLHILVLFRQLSFLIPNITIHLLSIYFHAAFFPFKSLFY